jgi:hypothetical protein
MTILATNTHINGGCRWCFYFIFLIFFKKKSLHYMMAASLTLLLIAGATTTTIRPAGSVVTLLCLLSQSANTVPGLTSNCPLRSGVSPLTFRASMSWLVKTDVKRIYDALSVRRHLTAFVIG